MLTPYSRSGRFRPRFTCRRFGRCAALLVLAVLSFAPEWAQARPSHSATNGKKGGEGTLAFKRQKNVYSNLDFFYTNRGVLFNAGNGQNEGLFWPRGSGDSYIFGEGLWFATKKDIQGKLVKLCDLGYNPNSGVGWYNEGEYSSVMHQSSDGIYSPSAQADAKYISYVSPRYNKTDGTYISGSSANVPAPGYTWPIWDTSTSKTLGHNFYFGDYISDTKERDALAKQVDAGPTTVKPAMFSEEDIVNEYTDQDPVNDPEFRPNAGYPFGIDVTEAIYSWSFGRYRDMIFLRQKVTNSNPPNTAEDSLIDCWMAPAFDPDLDAAVQNLDGNSIVDSTLPTTIGLPPGLLTQLREPYQSDLSKLNMGVQWSDYNKPPNGKQYGWIGFSFLESPTIDSKGNIVASDDSLDLHGYGPNSLFQRTPTPTADSGQLGLATFKDWVIQNDPSTQDLRYDFVSSGEKDHFNGAYGDQRLLMATGPFTLPPGKSVETVVGITIAQVDNTDYRKNFGAVLLLTDFAHQVFGEPTPEVLSPGDTGYVVNHFLSPVPPGVPNLKTTALDRAVLVSWDSTADTSRDVVSDLLGYPDSIQKKATLDFMGYQLWRSTRLDHDSTIRPDGVNPDVMLGQWQRYDFKIDSVFDTTPGPTFGHFNHFHYARTNSVPHPIPHSYLDIGDDNHDGILTGTEGLYNGVEYYYYLIAYDEYDSTNKIGPLYTAIVPPKNFVVGIPNKPVFLVPFNADTASGIAGNCAAGSGVIQPDSGGVQDIYLSIVDTGIFAKLFTNDTINVSFQPRWTEYTDNILDQSPMDMYVDVTDTKKGPDGNSQVNNTYATLQNPSKNTVAYYFPTSLPGAITYHVDGSITPDSTFGAQFSTDNSAFAPNQSVDDAFKVLADVNFEELSAPYRLSKVTVQGAGDPNILRLSHRTNNGSALDSSQNIFNLPGDSVQRPSILLPAAQITVLGAPLAPGDSVVRKQPGTPNDTVYYLTSIVKADTNTSGDTIGYIWKAATAYYHYETNSTRPSFLGALGQVTYDVTFGALMNPGPVKVLMQNGDAIYPAAMPITVSVDGCPSSILRPVKDTASDMTIENDWRFYSNTLTSTTGQLFPAYNDPDTMKVPNPGWFEMSAYHYEDQAAPASPHTNATFDNFQETASGAVDSFATVGPYYFPINGPNNFDANANSYTYTVHKLSVGGAEIMFNAPEIPDLAGNTTGDTIAGKITTYQGNTTDHQNPHTNDFQPGDKIMLSFTGLAKNLPFPGAEFHIVTESGPKVDFANTSNYTDSMLQQVQVVPNPYIVTHIGQTSTDNAKLFFTRLPPRCTIEIYALDGTLVQTIEHIGYASTTTPNETTGLSTTTYDYSQLGDQSSTETWNLLTSGGQRVGSQVLFARVVAKDPNSGAETGEVTTKFAVVVGQSK